LNNVDVDYYKWGTKVNATDGVLHNRQYNQYIMGVRYNQQDKHTKEYAHRVDPGPKILIFNTELMQEPPTKMEK